MGRTPKTNLPETAVRSRAARGWAGGMTQIALSQKLGHTDKQYVQRAEGGAIGAGYKRSDLIAIAAITGVPAEFMLDGWAGVARRAIEDAADRSITKAIEHFAASDGLGGEPPSLPPPAPKEPDS